MNSTIYKDDNDTFTSLTTDNEENRGGFNEYS